MTSIEEIKKKLTKENVVAGLIGKPVGHSLSPKIHNYWLSLYNIGGKYIAVEIEEQQLEEFVELIRNENIGGFNVTAPYKRKVLPFMDELDDNAFSIGAINNIANERGKLIGKNTDSYGLITSIEMGASNPPNFEIMNAVVVGSGGASRAVIKGLSKKKIHNLSIVSRDIEKGERLMRDINVDAQVFSIKDMDKALRGGGYFGKCHSSRHGRIRRKRLGSYRVK